MPEANSLIFSIIREKLTIYGSGEGYFRVALIYTEEIYRLEESRFGRRVRVNYLTIPNTLGE